jgi:hypothetical protein
MQYTHAQTPLLQACTACIAFNEHPSVRYVGETEKGHGGAQHVVFKEKLRAVNMDKDSLLRFTVVDKKDGTCRGTHPDTAIYPVKHSYPFVSPHF